MDYSPEQNCFCDSNKLFSKCCRPYLKGNLIAATPKQLMRSRYTAYTLGGHGDYLVSTWLGAEERGLTAAELSKNNQKWHRLEILGSKQTGDIAYVEFNAYYVDNEEKTQVMHEKSRFQRMSGRWYYVNGEVDSQIE